jgi:hypothetical protein
MSVATVRYFLRIKPKTYRFNGGDSQCLDLGIMEVSGSASCHGRFVPGERAPGTHWIRRQGGPQSRSGQREENILTVPGLEI